MTALQDQLKRLSKSKWWNSGLLVGLAMVIMIYTRFFGLSEPYIKAFDPYIFWRISEGIWTTGAWEGADALRYYPYGWDSSELAPALPHTLVYLGRIAGNLKSAVKFYPAVLGILSVIAMAFLGRRFGMAGLSAMIMAVLPAYMFRTSQGFADKEPLGFFLGVLGWYFAATALKERKVMPAIFSGISMGMISAVWGGKVLFALSLVPLLVILAMMEETKKVMLLSVAFVSYLFMHFFVPRYSTFYQDPVSLAILGVAAFGFLLYWIYKISSLEKYGKKRILIASGIGLGFVLIVSLFTFGNAAFIISWVTRLYQSPLQPVGTISHYQTVAENQRPAPWTWNLNNNQYYSQFGLFFLISLSVLLIPIIRKAYGLIRKKDAISQDYVYAAALLIASGKLLMDFPYETPVLLFLLGIPGLLDSRNWKEVFVNSIVAFSMYSAFSAVRLFTFTSVGVVIGAAYVMSLLLENVDSVVKIAGYLIVIYSMYQIYPVTLGYMNSLGGASLTTTWFENAKWMEFNVPEGEPVTTWWDYGYWIQTIGNSTSLGDGGNVGPGYELNWNTGHFFATDDYENATAWADDWNLTYFTIDSAMVAKYWAYSTLGGISNVINQVRYQQVYPTEFGMIDIYSGVSDDFGPVAIGELSTDGQPVYIIGKIVGGAIQWMGVIDEFSYLSNQGSLACDPIGYCPSGNFGNLERINQSVIVYPKQMIMLGDKQTMHSTFARLWFFDGYNTDFEMVLNNGETKTFVYGPNFEGLSG
ncbi:MAG: hypothetical protein GOV01_03020 [Candidatus Altiarchaeota archaeon]|nr:hypothetical protein [Candidatus Altiarchaeota archaeon]